MGNAEYMGSRGPDTHQTISSCLRTVDVERVRPAPALTAPVQTVAARRGARSRRMIEGGGGGGQVS